MIVNRDGIHWIEPDWPAPSRVRAASTLRLGGTSLPPFDSLNLALHVGDAPQAVMGNRRRVSRILQLPDEPCWLQQVHGNQVIAASAFTEAPVADASFTLETGKVCAVMTADCLPVLFCTRNGDRVAAAHAGWRGLVIGVLENTVHALGCAPSQLLAWLGPAIGCQSFEVGDEVYEAFCIRNSAHKACFVRNTKQRWWADLYGLATIVLREIGVHNIFSEAACTVIDASHYFSYRRDGQTGRMASMIWLQSQ